MKLVHDPPATTTEEPAAESPPILLKQERVAGGYTLVYVLVPSIDPVRPQVFAISSETMELTEDPEQAT